MVSSAARSTRAWQCGLDIGKRSDYSALCVARVFDFPSPIDGRPETNYEISVLDRLLLGTHYMDQVQTVGDALVGVYERAMGERGGSGITFEDSGTSPRLPTIKLSADETGVGDAFCDSLERLLRRDRRTAGIELMRVRWVAGERLRKVWEAGAMRAMVGKEYMVRKILTGARSGRVKLAAALEGRIDIEEEFRAYEARMREEDGHTTYGAMAPGTHDDLVSALILSILQDPRDYMVGMQSVTY